MRSYKTTLAHRRRSSRFATERYRSDPEFRLACVNRDRAKRGAPLLISPDEINVGWAQRPWADKGVVR